MEPLFFYIFASLAVLSVVFMIFQSNPVASAVLLVLSFFSLAALYVTLQAHFIAVIQILVYAGAIMVLFVFVIMLLNLKKEELVYDKFDFKKVIVALIGFAFMAFMIFHFCKIQNIPFLPVAKEFGTVKEVGKLMFSTYLIPFEMIAVLLLVGLVGAVLLGKREK